MKYVSTRGEAPAVGFVEASLTGLAPDGGLYTPETYPKLTPRPASSGYVETAAAVLSAFAGDDLSPSVLRELATKAYAPFAHQSVAPLVEVGPGRWMLELHHGPTLAFKDIAMRLIAELYDHVLGLRRERMLILCATSGDTGGAAAAAFAGSKNVDVVILHPHNRVSPTQRLFMTATGAANVHNLALEGDFDGTQAIVKALLSDERYRQANKLAAVNSINWTRVAAQSVYFAHAQAQFGPDRPLQFVVPTGNFGDALAGYVAGQCGLVKDFACIAAVNANDAFARLLEGGPLVKGQTTATQSPAMDIQLPSNFERLLFEAADRDGRSVKTAYEGLAKTGRGPLPEGAQAGLGAAGLGAERVSDEETLVEMQRTYAETGWIVCPHTAVGLAASRRAASTDRLIVTLATAHAAKFPETIERALGRKISLPDRAAAFLERGEVFDAGPMGADFVRARIDAIARGW